MDADLAALSLAVGERLRERGLTLATAESCTGGWVAQVVTATSGSSDWFERGFVSYSNGAKQELLGVQEATLRAHGAVSEATAAEMASGALAHSHAAVAVAVTGIAGPTGGTPQKPVGTVCFAWRFRDRAPTCATRRFEGDREAVRRQSVVFVLARLVELLEATAARS